MPKILCTFPGRHGDLLWALPTVRAIAEEAGDPVDLQIGHEFAGLVPLLQRQDYLDLVIPDSRWDVRSWEAPAPPEDLAGEYDRILHLGYRRWPEHSLPLETWTTYVGHYAPLPAPDLARPWIRANATKPAHTWPVPFVVGFTEAYFELKYGLYHLLLRHLGGPAGSLPGGVGPVSVCTGGRWRTEAHHPGCGWDEAARHISLARVVLADCSALHVLAVALGVPTLLCEPMEARWNPIFYPLGMDGPQVTVVRGQDGKPTFDARHVREALESYL